MDKMMQGKMLDAIEDWRRRLIDDNKASQSADFWNESEWGDETMRKAIRAAIVRLGEMEKAVGEWKEELSKIDFSPISEIDWWDRVEAMCILLGKIRDFRGER